MGDINPQRKRIIRKDKNHEIRQFQEVQTWLNTVAERTRAHYVSAMIDFCDFTGKTPTELIQQRDEELRNTDYNKRTGIRDLIVGFISYLEEKGISGNTIGIREASIRGFFTAVLGNAAMIKVKKYKNAQSKKHKDLVPTLEELRRILNVCNLEDKARIIFLAQTGMRISDALSLKIGDISRELELGVVPLAVKYLPEKNRDTIGERITFLATDGVEILKAYLAWRKQLGEKITAESPLFPSRTKRGDNPVSKQMINQMLHVVAKKIGLDGNEKYGILRAHSLRKFFITQMTNHGVQDVVVDFLVGHTLDSVHATYWIRRVDNLRDIYADREQHLNPLSFKQEYGLTKVEGLQAKIKDLEDVIKKMSVKMEEISHEKQKRFEAKIVQSETELLKYTSQGFDFQQMGPNKWLIKRTKQTDKEEVDLQNNEIMSTLGDYDGIQQNSQGRQMALSNYLRFL